MLFWFVLHYVRHRSLSPFIFLLTRSLGIYILVELLGIEIVFLRLANS